MRIFFKKDKSLIEYKDRIDVEGKYITTSNTNQREKAILQEYKNEEEAKEIFEKIVSAIDTGLKRGKENIFIVL